MRMSPLTLLAVLAVIPVSLPASAEGYSYGVGHRAYGYGAPRIVHGRGFAQPFIEGDYIGAPFTTVPRPSHLVPAPWSYGTYGVPTVSGITSPPVAAPSLTVIHAQGARRTGARAATVPGNVQEVNVSVPRR